MWRSKSGIGQRAKQLVLAPRINAPLVTALLLASVFSLWMWYGLTQRSITTDDGISLQAAQGVLQHGYQRFPSGYIYWRGFLWHYLLAGSVAVFGLNDFSVMAPSLLAAMASLLLVYFLARDILGRPWLGVLASALLVTLDLYAFYATSPRMYMLLQLLTLLAAWSAWRGFVLDRPPFQLVTFLAIAGAMLTHQEGVALVLAVPASVTAAVWLHRRSILQFVSWSNVLGTVFLGAVAFFTLLFRHPAQMPEITDFAGISPGYVGLNLNPVSWVENAFLLEVAFPYGLTLVPVLLYFIARSVPWKGGGTGQGAGLMYLLLFFVVAAAVILLTTTRRSDRFWFFVLPMYSLLIAYGTASLAGSLFTAFSRRTTARLTRAAGAYTLVVPLLLLGGLALNLGLVALAEQTSPGELAANGYLPSCSGLPCSKSVEEFYAALRPDIRPNDVLVSTNPMVTAYYLGRADGFLRQKRSDAGSYSAFASETDEYLGIPIIDTQEELDALVRGGRRVWIITDSKADWSISRSAVQFIQSNFREVYRLENSAAYVTAAGAG